MRTLCCIFFLYTFSFQAAFAIKKADLEGYWQLKDTVIKIHIDKSLLEGNLAKNSKRAKSVGFTLNETVMTKFNIDKSNVRFLITVRTDNPKLAKLCKPTQLKVSAKVSANFGAMTGTYENGEYQYLKDEKGNVAACIFVKKPGTRPLIIKRTYLTPPKIVRLEYKRMDSETALKDLVPLQFFRVVATLDQKPIPGHSETIVITNNRTKKNVSVKLTPFGKNKWLVSPMILVGLPDTPNLAPQIPSCPNDEIITQSGKLLKKIKVAHGDTTFHPAPCKPLPPPAAYTLTAVGSLKVQYNIQSNPKPTPLRVQLKDDQGKAVEGEEIIWLSKTTGEAFVTETNKKGIAVLDFMVSNRGIYHAVAEGLKIGNGYVDKNLNPKATASYYDFEVAPKNPLIAIGVSNTPPAFKIDFVRPTTIEIWTRKSSNITSVLYDDRFFIRIWPGRYIYKRTKPVTVTLRGSSGDQFTIQAKRTGAKVFETQTPCYANDSSLHSDNRLKVPKYLGKIRIMVLGSKATLPVYPTKHDRLYEEAIKRLALVEDVLTAAAKSPGLDKTQKANLKQKSGLVAKANRWMRERLTKPYKIALINTYLGLALMQPSELGAKINVSALKAEAAYNQRYAGKRPFPISIRIARPTIMRFHTTVERDKVLAAFLIVRTKNFKVVAKAIRGLFDISVQKIMKGLKHAIISPGLSLYTAVTGWTIDGERATTYQQVVGGVEAAIGLLALAETAVRLVSFARASSSFVKRVATGRSKSADLDFAHPNASSGLTVAKEVAEDAVKAAKATKRRKRRLKTYLTKVDAAGKNLVDLKKKRGSEHKLRKKLETELAQKKTELATRQAQGKTKNKGREKAIGVLERKIKRLDKRLDGLAKKIDKQVAKKLNAYRALGRMEREGLSRLQISELIQKRQIPDGHDRIGDTFVHRLYEDHVTQQLGKGFSKGYGIKLNSSHPGVLGKRFGEPLKKPKRQTTTKRPTMDHINKKTGDVADSKYYNFARKRRELSAEAFAEYKKKAAREIAETVEKGRMVQREMIRAKRRKKGLPELDDSMTENLVNRVVYQRQVIIVTPVIVPPDVQKLIKLLVGERSAKMLRFKVIPTDLPNWINKATF